MLDSSIHSHIVAQAPLIFKYEIQDKTDLENLLILVNLSKKKHLEVYIGKNNYANSNIEEHLLAVGNIPRQIIELSQQRVSMLELLQDLTPFKYEAAEDKVKYLGSFRHLNPDLFKTEHQDKLDSERVAKYTTWRPNSEEQPSYITPFREEKESEDRLDLVI